MKGKHVRYTAAELAFVEARRHLDRAELRAQFVAQFGRFEVTVAHLQGLCKRKRWARRTFFTAGEDAVLCAHFPHETTETTAARIGRSASAVHQRALRLKLRKAPAYLASAASGRIQSGERRGVGTEFKPGQTPANKGVKYPKGWAPGRMAETLFKPGVPSWRFQPIGSTRVVYGYEYTKITDTPKVAWTRNWRQTHRLRWEAAHGPVPAGHALKCVDGNRLNTDPDNWMAVPRSLLPVLNGGRTKKRLAYDAAPLELKPTVLAVAQLIHTAAKRRKAVA